MSGTVETSVGSLKLREVKHIAPENSWKNFDSLGGMEKRTLKTQLGMNDLKMEICVSASLQSVVLLVQVGTLHPSTPGHAPLASCPKRGTMRRDRKGWWVLRTAKGTNTEGGQQPKQENISTPQLMMAELPPPPPPLLHSVRGACVSDDRFFSSFRSLRNGMCVDIYI